MAHSLHCDSIMTFSMYGMICRRIVVLYQVFRTAVAQEACCCACKVACIEPGDEMNLVIENFVTTANLCCCCGVITVQDAVCETFRSGNASRHAPIECRRGLSRCRVRLTSR